MARDKVTTDEIYKTMRHDWSLMNNELKLLTPDDKMNNNETRKL